LHEVASQLENQPGVDHVNVNASTGSVLVHYDHTVREKDDIVGCLVDVGLLLGGVLEAGGDELPDLGGSESDGRGHSKTAASVVDTVSDLDRRLSQLTGRRVDLKLVFPVALGAIGLRSAIVNGIGLAEVPAYILLWYAFDSFWKFHQRPVAAASPADGTQDSTVPA
jgi:copper chaperone CopZ